MIVVVGSRHDSVATDLVALWPRAALCSAEDLVHPGWVWPQGQTASRTWIVNTRPVRDEQVTGVFIRRSTVYTEELAAIHPADRAYLAAEAHAFLTFVLATTSARVVNQVVEGAFGEEALRPERLTASALRAGIPIRPARVASEPRRRPVYHTHQVEVAGDEVLGDVPSRVRERAGRLASALGMTWGLFIFDAHHQLVTVTGAHRPSDRAAAALGRLLKAGRS